jgi:hypothetical protein
MTAGAYDVTLMYTSKQPATVKLSFGTYQDIKRGAATTISAQLPQQASARACCTQPYVQGFKAPDVAGEFWLAQHSHMPPTCQAAVIITTVVSVGPV